MLGKGTGSWYAQLPPQSTCYLPQSSLVLPADSPLAPCLFWYSMGEPLVSAGSLQSFVLTALQHTIVACFLKCHSGIYGSKSAAEVFSWIGTLSVLTVIFALVLL